ncbi:MAG: hypothetical protein AABX85_02880 [Nanoarchaeota archaeon]
MAIEVRTKQWGNSIGIVIPAEAVDKFRLKPNENLVIEINKKDNVLKELFGALNHNKKPTEQILKEARKELDSKWLK